MIEPKMIQVPDFSDYIKKEFIVVEDVDMTHTDIKTPILKGVRFIISNINNSMVTIKISNTKKELEKLGMLDYHFNKNISSVKKEIKILNKIHSLWENEPDKFIIDEDSPMNGLGDGRHGHCINTGYYDIPINHPDKHSTAKPRYHDGVYVKSDAIMTFDYKRIDDVRNLYSYQKGRNTFYSKTVYEYMIKKCEIDLHDWENRCNGYKTWVFGWILSKKQLSINSLNNMKFELYNR